MVLVAPEGKELLCKHSAYLFTDGTIDTYEGRLLLTMAMVLVEEVGIPLAFFLHSHKTQEEYPYFFKMLKSLTDNCLNPRGIFGDYEDALRAAAEQVFSSAIYNGDYFHFLQANIK